MGPSLPATIPCGARLKGRSSSLSLTKAANSTTAQGKCWAFPFRTGLDTIGLAIFLIFQPKLLFCHQFP